MTNKNIINTQVFDQSCSVYLRHIGIQVEDGDRIDCPYRKSSDSGAFEIGGCFWRDYPTGDKGNVYQLALRMHNDNKRAAVRSLYESAGIPMPEYEPIEKVLTDREKAMGALVKVQEKFGIIKNSPKDVLGYLHSRGVTEKTYKYFAYIPDGQLSTVLSNEEAELTGLEWRQGLIILWYFKQGKPVYYCTREIGEGGFKKATTKTGILVNPIWNADALYSEPNLIWAEGMFDCIALIEMGYGVAGEITCHLAENHEDELLKALRWRIKNHQEWTFTICLDNDEEKNGKRIGNEAAERIATWLWSKGIDVKWVKHNPADDKVDINDLYCKGVQGQIRHMIDNSKCVSKLLTCDEEMCLRNFVRMITHYDYKGANSMIAILQEQDANKSIKEIIDRTHNSLWNWRNVYSSEVKDMFFYDGDIYVVFKDGFFASGDKKYEVFKKNNMTSNIRRYQINRSQKIKLNDLDIQGKRPKWQVSRQLNRENDTTYNLFSPSPLLLQKPRDNTPLPIMWSMVLDNLAGKEEKEWLLNLMAYYVQTLEKTRVIPLFLGNQGTGKTKSIEFFGRGIGGYVAVGNSEVESQFNEYLQNPVVLLDELASSTSEANRLKNKVKAFVNDRQTINIKNEKLYTVVLNNFIAIASNEQVAYVPVQIEANDRRFTVITGGADRNLAEVDWFNYREWEKELPDFMLYLLSRDYDEALASTPLMNEKKQELMGMGQDFRVSYVSEYMEELRHRGLVTGEEVRTIAELCREVNERHNLKYEFTSKGMKPILNHLGYPVYEKNHQACIKIEPFIDEAVTLSDSMMTTTTTTLIPVSSYDDLWSAE